MLQVSVTKNKKCSSDPMDLLCHKENNYQLLHDK
jgi:hypothetical protein